MSDFLTLSELFALHKQLMSSQVNLEKTNLNILENKMDDFM